MRSNARAAIGQACACLTCRTSRKQELGQQGRHDKLLRDNVCCSVSSPVVCAATPQMRYSHGVSWKAWPCPQRQQRSNVLLVNSSPKRQSVRCPFPEGGARNSPVATNHAVYMNFIVLLGGLSHYRRQPLPPCRCGLICRTFSPALGRMLGSPARFLKAYAITWILMNLVGSWVSDERCIENQTVSDRWMAAATLHPTAPIPSLLQ